MASTAIIVTDYRRQIPGKLSEPDTPGEESSTYCFPQINSVNNRTGKATLWRIIVRLFEVDGSKQKFIPILDEYFDNKPMPGNIRGWIKVISKVEGGKIRDSTPTIVKIGKNVDRSNKTNVFCQTLRDAYSLHNKQLKKTLSGGQADATTTQLLPPMLAQLKSEQKDPIDYSKPSFIQRKLNGVRAISVLDKIPATVPVAEGVAEYRAIIYSRKRKLYPGFNYLKQEIKPILMYLLETRKQLVYLDGEVYLHGTNLQTISGIARREDNDNLVHLQYHIYDCFIPAEPQLTYSARKQILDDAFEWAKNNIEEGKGPKYLIEVETIRVHNDDEVDALFKQYYQEEDYEGAMLRMELPYKYSFNDYHSNHLLKIKPALDKEFEIIGYTEGKKGKAKGALMFILQTEDGKEFTVTPGLELDERKRLYSQMDDIDPDGDGEDTIFENKYLGQMLTVIFDEYSANGIPVRARTEGIRLRDMLD